MGEGESQAESSWAADVWLWQGTACQTVSLFGTATRKQHANRLESDGATYTIGARRKTIEKPSGSVLWVHGKILRRPMNLRHPRRFWSAGTGPRFGCTVDGFERVGQLECAYCGRDVK